MSRNLRALVGALALSIAIVPSVFAGSISESLSVNSVLLVTGIPSSISYGNVDPGATSATQSFTANVTTNGAGYTFAMSGSNFSGPATINKNTRYAQFQGGTNTSVSGPQSFTDFGSSMFDGTTTLITGSAGASSFSTDLRVAVPAAQVPGNYSGTITYTFTGS